MAIGGQNPIEEIKERLSIVDVVGQRVQLKKAGRTLKGLCPFHNEKTPSFIVSPDRGTYHCFGCGEGGDIFAFLMKTENLDFPEALEALAQRAGVTLKPRAVAAKDDERRERIFQLNAAAAQYYYSVLRGEQGRTGYDYLKRRGVTDATIESWQLGYAPDAWDSLLKYLTARGHDRAAIVEAGLAVERDSGARDTFRGRVLFPIRDSKGSILGFGGRILGDGQPKYLNTPASPVFDKGGCLFGIDVARTAIREAGRGVIVEGYMDALIAHQFGIRNVVGALGTALTDRQVGLLKRLTKTLVLALDPDAAGEKAALKGLEVARQAYGEAVPIPQPGGLVRMEQRLDADLRIATLPDGLDPDEVIRRDPAEWHRIIDAAKPTVEFYFDVILNSLDLGSAKGVSAAADQLLPVIGEVQDQVQQSFYLARLADRLKVNVEALRAELHRDRLRAAARGKPAARRRPPPAEAAPAKSTSRPSTVLDEYYVELALQAYRRTGRPPALLGEGDLDDDSVARLALRWVLGRSGPAASDLTAAIVAARGDLPEQIAEWLATRAEGGHGTPLLDDAQVQSQLDYCANEIRRRNLHWRTEEMVDLMRGEIATGDAGARSERELVAATSDLLAQIRLVELGTTRAAVWRPAAATSLLARIERPTKPAPPRASQRSTPTATPAPPDWQPDTFSDEETAGIYGFDPSELDESPPNL